MRTIKDFPNTNIEDKFYDINSPIGILISKLKQSLVDEERFLDLLKQIVYWDYPRISLWAFDDILNHIDSLLQTISDDHRLLTILNFLKILIANSFHKDIFSSFDRLERIFMQTRSIKVKNSIIEIYLLFSEIKKSIMNNYTGFITECSFVIPLRSIFTDFLLNLRTPESESDLEGKTKVAGEFFMEIEKIFSQMIKDAKILKEYSAKATNSMPNSKDIHSNKSHNIDESGLKLLLKNILVEGTQNFEKFQEIQAVLENSFNINHEKLYNRENITKEEESSLHLYNLFFNFFVFSSHLEINPSSENIIELSKFTLNMLNLLIFTQKNSKIPLISEYYIEKYLKDVLAMLTSKYSLELKSVYLLSTIGFVTYFDGYENILFQNGLFHSILSDMTTPKLQGVIHELEVLSYEESIDQDFFMAVLLFLYRTSSFKEIPVQFLDKVLESPQDNVYPYRIDNVIFSLKKKRTLDENTLNELVIPRLIYELDHFWVEETELKYMTAEKATESNSSLTSSMNYKNFPSIYERSYLILKLFKILSSIFEHNTNSSSLRYYESKIINAIDGYIKILYSKLEQLDEIKGSLFEPLFTGCVDFISKICYFLPSKIPSLIEMTTLSTIFDYLTKRIPSQPNVLNLVFHLIATVNLTEDGSKFLQENQYGIKVFDKVFETILFKDEYFLSNVFNQHGFYTDDFYNPYTYFLRVENANNILVHFFNKVNESIDWLKEKLGKIFKNEDTEVKLGEILDTKHPNFKTCRYSNRITLIGQFFMHLTQEEKDQLTKNNLIPLEDLVLNYFELVFHPLNLFMLQSTVISATMVKGVFQSNPEKLLDHIYELMCVNMNVLNIQNEFVKSSFDNSNQMLIDEPVISLTPFHKDKILSKLVHLVEFTTKKLFNLIKDKSIFHKFIKKLSVIMIYLVKRQSNISIYLSPVNDCGLIINRKSYFKFLSSKLNSDLRQILVDNTRRKERSLFMRENTSDSSSILIFDEKSCLDIKYRQSFQTNMRVEIVDGNNPFTTDLIDNVSKIIINSHMPVLDFYISIGKCIKKNLKSFTQTEISIFKCWNTLTQSLVLILSSLDLDNKLQHFKQIFSTQDKTGDLYNEKLQEVIETFIFYINILNNINIVISDKVISCYVIIQFVKLGGVEHIFDICSFLLKFCQILEDSSPNNEYPLILLLLIKNLWNIITSITTRIIKINFENIQNLNLILVKEGFSSSFDFSCFLKSQIAWNLYNKFFNDELQLPLKRISALSYSFHSLIYSILDVCIMQWKELVAKETDDEKIIEEVVLMGFKRGEVIAALLEGKKKSEDIVNFILTSNKVNESNPENSNQGSEGIEGNEVNVPQVPTNLKLNDLIEHNDFDEENFELLKNEFSEFFNLSVKSDDLKKKFEMNKNLINSNQSLNRRKNLKENYSLLFDKIYNKIIEEDISNVKISQLRKMNILFRIREVTNQANKMHDKILIPFLKEVFILERESCIELQSKDVKENIEGLKKLLQNRMLINYIILKDRLKAADIFKNLDLVQMEEFFQEFKVVENSLMTIKFILTSIDAERNINENSSNGKNFDEEFIQNIRNIIYECLFVIHLSLHFLNYYSSKEKNSLFSADSHKKEYFDVISEIIEIQMKFVSNNSSDLILLDEQNLIIIFSTIVENFEYDQTLQDFIEKGALRNLLKLRKSQNSNYESFNDAKFKSKVVFDEAFRIFLFKIFEDDKMIEKNLEMIIRYIFANVYNNKTNSSYATTYRKKQKKAKKESNANADNAVDNQQEEIEMENESQIKSDEEREDIEEINERTNVINSNQDINQNNNSATNNNVTNYKSNFDSAADMEQSTNKQKQVEIEVNLDDFMNIIYPVIPKNTEILIAVLNKFCILDKKIEKQIKSAKKKKTSGDIQIVLKLKEEFNNSIIQLANEMRNQVEKEKEVENEDISNQNAQKDNTNPNPNILSTTPTKARKESQLNNNISNNNFPQLKESSRKQIENLIENITKQFSHHKVSIVNTIINQLWQLTTEVEKEIDKHFLEINSNFSNFNLNQKYMIDLDTLLIAFGNLINCYPSVLAIILKFHKKNVNVSSTNKKNKISFISFLIRKIFYIMQFYKNCIQSDEKDQSLESLNKEKDDVKRKLGFEVNSHQSAMEGYRNHNIISYIMQRLCYKRRNMTADESYLIVKARKKILKEIDQILKEIKPKKEDIGNATISAAFNSNTKNLLTYKITIFCLYTLTEFHDSSHLFSHMNPFEISKLLISQSKDHYEIVANVVDTMKNLSLSNPFSFAIHRLSTLFMSELLKFIRLNPKFNYKGNTLRSKSDNEEAKLLFKTISNSHGEFIIEADILEEGNNLNGEDADIIMEEGINVMNNLINNLDEEGGESNEAEDELDNDENEDNEEEDVHEEIEGEEEEEDHTGSNSSEHDFFYSGSSSQANEEDSEDDDSEDDDEEENDWGANAEEQKEDEGDAVQVNLDSPLIRDNLNDEENEDFDEGEGEEEYSNEEELDDEYIINENDDQANEISVRFEEEEANELHNVDRSDDTESNSYESDANPAYGEGRANGTWGRSRFNLNAFGSRLNNLTSILLNSNENPNVQEDQADVLFFNPTFEKTGKAENAMYFEENVTFPFMLYLMNEELMEFSKPGVYISVINKLKRRQLDSINSVFILRFITPFDKKTKRNLYFALNACKEKVITAYNKELNKMEVDLVPLYTNDQFKHASDDSESLESIKETVCKSMGIDLKELRESKGDKNSSDNVLGTNAQGDDINLTESDNKKDSDANKEEKNLQLGEGGRNASGANNFDNQGNFGTDNVGQRGAESNKPKEEDLIDPEFLEHIPEDLREDVLLNQKRLMEDNSLVNQYYNPEDIDPDLLNEVNPDLMPSVLNSNNNFENTNEINQPGNQANEVVNNANVDSATFIYSLPIDIREEILLTSDLNFIRSLPQDLRDEAHRLFAVYDPDRLLIMNEDIEGSPNQEGNVHIEFIDNDLGFNQNQQIDRPPFSWLLNPVKENKKFTFKPPKFQFEEILSKQKHQKEQTSFIINTLDDDFIEKLIAFNIKFTCESSPKTKINNNQYWILINNLIQNSDMRYKILDLLFVLWILDSMCLKRLLRENKLEMHNANNNFEKNSSGNILNKSPILRFLHELYVENKILEEFFYDDYDQFVKNFCQSYPKEMKKFFLETFYTEKGEYVSVGGKKHSISKNITWLKDLLKINFEKDENVLSNLIRIMITNSKSDIKKIFALKIFTNIVTNCFSASNIEDSGKNSNNNLSISVKTIERVVDLFNNFETVLEINKDKKSNNPTQLLCELIVDDKCFKMLLNVLNNHIQTLNKAVSYEMDHFFTDKKIDINVFSKPLPENVLFKIIKLVNQMNVAINKRSDKEEVKEPIAPGAVNPEAVYNVAVENQMIVDVAEEENRPLLNIIEEDSSSVAKPQKKYEMIKQELNEFIKEMNLKLIKCWEKLDLLLYEISKRMKEDQKIIDPKLNRLIPYLEAFITLSHLQFLPENKGQITLKPFIMEDAYKRTPRKTPQHGYFEIFDDFNEFFVKFCDKNKKVINLILRRYPKMFPPEILIKISKFLDLENKKKYFKYELRKLKTGKDNHINLRVRRDHIFMDSYTQLRSKKPDEIRGRLTITFIGEEAVDAGGVKREWFTLLSKEMFNPDYMLFKQAANGNTYMPNSESGMFESDHLELFAFIGKVIAKAIYDGFMLDCYFTRGFYKLICNIPLTYHDMEDVDTQYFKNLKWLLETDISDMGDLLTFSYEEDRLGKLEAIDLIPNGRNIPVTEENKFDYVQKICYAKLFDTIKPQMEALQKGFYDIIQLKLISIFDHRELELVISGLPTVDVQDLKNNTIYENYTTESQVIVWFWSLMDSWDNNERAEFLQFVTGSSKVPLEGFSALQGIGGINKFKISKVFDKNFDRLPTAHTCTNQLDLPEYPSKEILIVRINLAIREGKVGFGFI